MKQKRKRLPRWQQELMAIKRGLKEVREMIAGSLPAPKHVYPLTGGAHVLRGLRCWCGPEVWWEGEYATIVHRREQ